MSRKPKKLLLTLASIQIAVLPVNIKGNNVDVVEEYKYLGNIIDHKLKGNLNVSQIYKKCNQRLYFLRMLKNRES